MGTGVDGASYGVSSAAISMLRCVSVRFPAIFTNPRCPAPIPPLPLRSALVNPPTILPHRYGCPPIDSAFVHRLPIPRSSSRLQCRRPSTSRASRYLPAHRPLLGRYCCARSDDTRRSERRAPILAANVTCGHSTWRVRPLFGFRSRLTHRVN